MLWSLSLLTVIGQCFFVSCRLYEYHLIEENKTWDQAQDYCMEKYTDLASVSDMNDAKRISELVKQTGAWIGLRSNQGAENKRWHWSMPELPDVELSDIKMYFQDNQPDDHEGKENCVEVLKGKLNDNKCSSRHRFICFNGTNPANERFILINKTMTWTQAQQYCREHHTDLAGGLDLFNDTEFLSLVSESSWWIGLVRDTSDKSSSSSRDLNQSEDESKEEECPFVMEGSEECSSGDCDHEKPFICYDETNPPNERFILIGEAMTWTAAQQYCREHHTDLAGQTNLCNNKEFLSLVSTRRWIGLFRDTWSWSDGSNSSFRHWDEPKDVFEEEECAFVMEGSGKWRSGDCDSPKPFICYDDKMILVNKTLTWEGALDYCREHYRDLVCINDHEQQKLVQAKAEQADTDHVWLGMRYTCVLDLWFWVNDNLVCYYKNWSPTDEYKKNECYHAGAMEKKWEVGEEA